jgi:hypothetical protein
MRYSRLDPTEKDRFRDWISDLVGAWKCEVLVSN